MNLGPFTMSNSIFMCRMAYKQPLQSKTALKAFSGIVRHLGPFTMPNIMYKLKIASKTALHSITSSKAFSGIVRVKNKLRAFYHLSVEISF